MNCLFFKNNAFEIGIIKLLTRLFDRGSLSMKGDGPYQSLLLFHGKVLAYVSTNLRTCNNLSTFPESSGIKKESSKLFTEESSHDETDII